MARRWTSRHRVAWTPILTFTRRRLALLDWLESHTSPIAFTDEPHAVGVAYVAKDLRILVDKRGMTIDLGVTEASRTGLDLAIDGVLSVLEPAGAVLQRSSTTWTVNLGEVDYNEARGQFARSALNAAHAPMSGWRPTDGSVLTDLENPRAGLEGQVEYGVVTADELADRLIHDQGRIHDPSRRLPSLTSTLTEALESAPPVAMFAEVVTTRLFGGEVATVEDIWQEVDLAQDAVSQLIDSLHSQIWPSTAKESAS